MIPELVTLAVHPDGTTDVVVEPAHPCARCGVPTILGAVRMLGTGNEFTCWTCSSKPDAGPSVLPDASDSASGTRGPEGRVEPPHES